MSNLWWLQPGWIETLCANCGAKIWPEGDPDHGVCFSCFQQQFENEERRRLENEAMEEHYRRHPHG